MIEHPRLTCLKFLCLLLSLLAPCPSPLSCRDPHAPKCRWHRTGESQTSNAFVQVPLSFPSVTSAQGLSVRSMEEAVIVEWWLSAGKGEINLKLNANYGSRYQVPSHAVFWVTPAPLNTRFKHHIYGKKQVGKKSCLLLHLHGAGN